MIVDPVPGQPPNLPTYAERVTRRIRLRYPMSNGEDGSLCPDCGLFDGEHDQRVHAIMSRLHELRRRWEKAHGYDSGGASDARISEGD